MQILNNLLKLKIRILQKLIFFVPMSLSITSLNSGSNGNCYYIGNETDAVLIDAGISCRETEKRMLQLGLSITKVKAIFISHEHSDHIRGLQILAAKYGLPVYITPLTLLHSRIQLPAEQIKRFHSAEPVRVGEMEITAFPKHHDAEDPHSFIIECKGIKVGVFTDIGAVCSNVINNFNQCHAAFLEANYDEELLANGSYPFYLKKRITGGKGHLSNKQALEIFTMHRPSFMSHLLLSHLSKDNNCPVMVKQLFDQQAHNTEIVIAGRYEATAVFYIGKKELNTTIQARRKKTAIQLAQLSLF